MRERDHTALRFVQRGKCARSFATPFTFIEQYGQRVISGGLPPACLVFAMFALVWGMKIVVVNY